MKYFKKKNLPWVIPGIILCIIITACWAAVMMETGDTVKVLFSPIYGACAAIAILFGVWCIGIAIKEWKTYWVVMVLPAFLGFFIGIVITAMPLSVLLH